MLMLVKQSAVRIWSFWPMLQYALRISLSFTRACFLCRVSTQPTTFKPFWMCSPVLHCVSCRNLHFPLPLQPDVGRLDLELPEELSPYKLILMALNGGTRPNGNLIAKGKLFAEIWKQLPFLVVTSYMYLMLISSVNSIVFKWSIAVLLHVLDWRKKVIQSFLCLCL